MDKPKFKLGDIVKIREEKTLAKVVKPIQDEDGSFWYEVEPVDFKAACREVRQSDLSAVSNEL